MEKETSTTRCRVAPAQTNPRREPYLASPWHPSSRPRETPVKRPESFSVVAAAGTFPTAADQQSSGTSPHHFAAVTPAPAVMMRDLKGKQETQRTICINRRRPSSPARTSSFELTCQDEILHGVFVCKVSRRLFRRGVVPSNPTVMRPDCEHAAARAGMEHSQTVQGVVLSSRGCGRQP